MSNSSLVNYTKLSPNNSGKRQYAITRISPHCVVGQCSVERLGDLFAKYDPYNGASCNYGIGFDGRVGMYVEESNRSWCTSSWDNDNRAVTIECASDAYAPYAFKDVVYQKLIQLCADICKRNGKDTLLWIADKNQSLNYKPASNEMVLTVHRWFANKACPGDWLMARMGDLAQKVTNMLKSPNKPIKPKDQYLVAYSSHCQSYGWLPYVGDGEMSGTTGQSKRMEALKVLVNKPKGVTGNIWTQAHVQGIGWMDPVKDDQIAGTTGKSKRIEAVKIALSNDGNIAKKYDVYYRVHCQTYGWLDWAKNGAIAGTTGLSKAVQAIEIKLVPKGGKAPGPTAKPSITK